MTGCRDNENAGIEAFIQKRLKVTRTFQQMESSLTRSGESSRNPGELVVDSNNKMMFSAGRRGAGTAVRLQFESVPA